MSYTETHVGKLRKVDTGGNTENWCKDYCHVEGIYKLASYNNNWIEEFRDHFHDTFLVIEDSIYNKFAHTESDGEDVFHIEKNSDGTYTFVMQFYNGGTCLDECLEEGLKKLNKFNK